MVYRDPDLLKRIGAATALEVRATGIPYTFAPCIAVSTFSFWRSGIKKFVLCNNFNFHIWLIALCCSLRFVEIQDGVVVMKVTVKIIQLSRK